MTKTTALSAQNSLTSALRGYKEDASSVKDAYRVARKAIQDDPMTSDLAKKEKLTALDADTRAQLDSIRGKQEAYVAGLKSKIEGELRGVQPTDANSILLRRDAADRVRKLTDKQEAMDVLTDAIANGDPTLAHAVGARARNIGMGAVSEAYQAAFPDSADSAQALAYVEANTSGAAYNVGNQMTYAAPNV